MRPEIHESAGSFRPDDRGIHRFRGLRRNRDYPVFHVAPLSIRRKSTLARRGLVAIICTMIDYGNKMSIYRTWTQQLLSCLHPLHIAAVLSKHGCWLNTGQRRCVHDQACMLKAYAGIRLGIPNLFSTHLFRVATRTSGALLWWLF